MKIICQCCGWTGEEHDLAEPENEDDRHQCPECKEENPFEYAEEL
jgi:hypothetical protein